MWASNKQNTTKQFKQGSQTEEPGRQPTLPLKFNIVEGRQVCGDVLCGLSTTAAAAAAAAATATTTTTTTTTTTPPRTQVLQGRFTKFIGSKVKLHETRKQQKHKQYKLSQQNKV